jgi:hypothetical protein
MARPERFELPTLWFEARCSDPLSYGRVKRLSMFMRRFAIRACSQLTAAFSIVRKLSEILKHDGYRALAHIWDGNCELVSQTEHVRKSSSAPGHTRKIESEGRCD